MPDTETRWITPATGRRFRLGDVVIAFVPDGFVELEPEAWYQTRSFRDRPRVDEGGYLVGSVGCVVVEEPDGLVIIDAGLGRCDVPAERTHPSLGRLKGGAMGEWDVAASGVVQAIAITHAHEDHVGWLRSGSDLDLVPPGAEVIAGQPDVERLRQVTGRSSISGLRGGEQISRSVRAVATPGHTAGHMAYLVESSGQQAVIFGDVFHHPVQMHDPSLTPWSDEIPDLARRSRGLVLEMLAPAGTIGVGYHFADVVFGTVGTEGWVPLG